MAEQLTKSLDTIRKLNIHREQVYCGVEFAMLRFMQTNATVRWNEYLIMEGYYNEMLHTINYHQKKLYGKQKKT